MALSLALTLSEGIELPSSYARISSINHSHAETIVNVEFFASQAARQADKRAVLSQSYSLPWADSVSLTNAYISLKTLEQFALASDT